LISRRLSKGRATHNVPRTPMFAVSHGPGFFPCAFSLRHQTRFAFVKGLPHVSIPRSSRARPAHESVFFSTSTRFSRGLFDYGAQCTHAVGNDGPTWRARLDGCPPAPHIVRRGLPRAPGETGRDEGIWWPIANVVASAFESRYHLCRATGTVCVENRAPDEYRPTFRHRPARRGSSPGQARSRSFRRAGGDRGGVGACAKPETWFWKLADALCVPGSKNHKFQSRAPGPARSLAPRQLAPAASETPRQTGPGGPHHGACGRCSRPCRHPPEAPAFTSKEPHSEMKRGIRMCKPESRRLKRFR